MRVLVVEDELLIRWSIAETLGQAGHTVIEADNGAAAVRALTNSAEPVDVVMLDYRLPDSNDLTLLAAIRRLAPSSGVITQLGEPDALLLFGPGEAKLQLTERLGRSKVLSGSIVAVESADKLTDPQIVAKVKNHYGSAQRP